MAVAKRQGREKPAKIEQKKVRGLEGGPQVKKKTKKHTPEWPNLHRTDPGRDKHIKRSQS